jgi:hypothetical protein
MENLNIAERIFSDAFSYAKCRAIYHRSRVRIMVDVSSNSEYSHRKIIIAVQKTGEGGELILEKQKEILLPHGTFFITKNFIEDTLGLSSAAKYFWDSCLFIDGGKTLNMVFRDIDGLGQPIESLSIKHIVYAVGVGSCMANASNQFNVKFLKNTHLLGGVLLPHGNIITLDSSDKIVKLLE